jgi:hypothetical protein
VNVPRNAPSGLVNAVLETGRQRGDAATPRPAMALPSPIWQKSGPRKRHCEKLAKSISVVHGEQHHIRVSGRYLTQAQRAQDGFDLHFTWPWVSVFRTRCARQSRRIRASSRGCKQQTRSSPEPLFLLPPLALAVLWRKLSLWQGFSVGLSENHNLRMSTQMY